LPVAIGVAVQSFRQVTILFKKEAVAMSAMFTHIGPTFLGKTPCEITPVLA